MPSICHGLYTFCTYTTIPLLPQMHTDVLCDMGDRVVDYVSAMAVTVPVTVPVIVAVAIPITVTVTVTVTVTIPSPQP